MRISSLAASLLLFISAFSAFAEESPRKDLDLGTSFGYQGLALRKLVNENNLVFLGVGYGKTMYDYQNTFGTSSYSNNNKYNDYYVVAGIRHYLSSDRLSNFIELELIDSHTSGTQDSSSGTHGNSSGRSTTAVLGYGLEYFLDAHLSIEARAGVAYSYSKSKISDSSSSNSATSKDLYLPTAGIAITRYW